jgi:hypothetical protein
VHEQLAEDSLAELGRAERAAAPADLGSRIASRLDRPGFAARLPLGLAGLVRQAGMLLQPAVAGGAVATAAGLALGTWIALGTGHSASSDAGAQEPYALSSLVDDDASGLAASYFETDPQDMAPPDAGSGTPLHAPRDTPDGGLDSGVTAPNPVRGER